MADAVVALWHGANYQARVFWDNALNLLMPESRVVEVTFEANGPRAFDDVVVKVRPPGPALRPGPRLGRIPPDQMACREGRTIRL